MNLRFTPTVLTFIFSIDSAGARGMGDAILGSDLADVHSDNIAEVGNEKAKLANSISTSLFEQGVSSRRRFYHPDVGILHLQGEKSRRRFGNDIMNGRGHRKAGPTQKFDHALRFLQQAEEAPLPLCGTNGTCLPSACDCRANVDFISDHCAPVINSVCDGYTDADGKEWNVDRCFMYYADYPDRHEYYKTMHCQVSKCFDEGGTYGSCYCQWYDFLCQTYGDERRYIKDTRALGLCAAAECCQNKTDNAGRRSCTFGSPSRDEYSQENPRCGTNGTCEPSFCDSYVNAGQFFDFAVPANALCNGVTDANGKEWGIEGCIRDYPGYPDYQRYFKTQYCELAQCFVDGGTEVACYCQMYHSLCEMFGDARKYYYTPNTPGLCKIDTCCQSKSTLMGKLACLENPTATASPDDSLSSSAPNSTPLTSAGAISTFVATAAVLLLGFDAM